MYHNASHGIIKLAPEVKSSRNKTDLAGKLTVSVKNRIQPTDFSLLDAQR